MPARWMDGRKLAARIEDDVRTEVAKIKKRTGLTPQLDAVLVGDDSASALYVKRKEEACARVGIATKTHRLSDTSPPVELGQMLDALSSDPMITGILLQLPLPKGWSAPEFFPRIHPEKDVDCFHPTNTGLLMEGIPRFVPATPQGVLELLDAENVRLKGARVVIVNHSSLVGKPLAVLLLQREATVTVCHKYTKDLKAHTSEADVLITATGVPGLITAEHVRPGSVVVDVGISRDRKGKVVGDVAQDEVAGVAHALTPVPGGVGPMTIAMLLRNILTAFRLQHSAGGRA